MSRGINKVILIGNLGNDPDVRYTQSGDAIANVSLATSETWKDKNTGEPQERTEWHRVVFFGKVAEIVKDYLHKGSKIYVEGQLRTRKWQDKDGQDRYSTEVVANRVQSLGGRPQGGEGGSSGMRPQGAQQGGQQPRGNQPQAGGNKPPFHDDEDLGPAFPSEASGMDDVPF